MPDVPAAYELNATPMPVTFEPFRRPLFCRIAAQLNALAPRSTASLHERARHVALPTLARSAKAGLASRRVDLDHVQLVDAQLVGCLVHDRGEHLYCLDSTGSPLRPRGGVLVYTDSPRTRWLSG